MRGHVVVRGSNRQEILNVSHGSSLTFTLIEPPTLFCWAPAIRSTTPDMRVTAAMPDNDAVNGNGHAYPHREKLVTRT